MKNMRSRDRRIFEKKSILRIENRFYELTLLQKVDFLNVGDSRIADNARIDICIYFELKFNCGSKFFNSPTQFLKCVFLLYA